MPQKEGEVANKIPIFNQSSWEWFGHRVCALFGERLLCKPRPLPRLWRGKKQASDRCKDDGDDGEDGGGGTLVIMHHFLKVSLIHC